MKNYKLETLEKMLERAIIKRDSLPSITNEGWGAGMRKSKLTGEQWFKADNRVCELREQIKLKKQELKQGDI